MAKAKKTVKPKKTTKPKAKPKPKKPKKASFDRVELEKLLLGLAEVSSIPGQSISQPQYDAIKAKLDEIFGSEDETLSSPSIPGA